MSEETIVIDDTKIYSQAELDAKIKEAKDAADQRVYNHVERCRVRDNDMEIIATALRSEAESREWCSQYNEWITEVNEKTTIHKLYPMQQTYTIKFRLERQQYVYVEAEVVADNEDDAREKADSDFDYWDMAQDVDDNDWKDDSSSIEVRSVEEQ